MKNDYRECSDYLTKSKVLKNLIDCIKKKKSAYSVNTTDKQEILDFVEQSRNLFNNELLLNWFSRNYLEFNSIVSQIIYLKKILN